jgi:hypothetical protein
LIQNSRNLALPNRLRGSAEQMRHSKVRAKRGRKKGSQPLRVTAIRVADGNGDQLNVYRREHKSRLPIVGIIRKVFSYELDTGERVEFLDNDTFILNQTGEKLTRVKNVD